MNLKIHLGALTLIILLLVLIYAMQNEPAQEVKKTEGYFVEISNASYGLNCLDKKGNIYDQYTDPAEQTAYRNESAPPLRMGNALVKISNLCNGKESCEIYVNAAELGIKAAPRCLKQLAVEYRCFSYDRLWLAKGNEGDRVAIDCRNRTH